jgi:hypothetical protein
MDKEAQLRALRELTDANKPANNANGSANIDDIAVTKYLDGLRRKATTIEEVDIIDVIVKALFHEGVNKITGRVHGERAAIPETEQKSRTDRKAYQRDLMRKRRAKNAG